jgi:putative zinc finger/helix-turn-helix YgiT family protein
MRERSVNCPRGHGEMKLQKTKKCIMFRGESLELDVEHLVCSVCGLEAGTLEQTGKVQKAIADAYREKVGMLSGKEIIQKRHKTKLSQQKLADMAKVGIASIKRWEGGMVQSKAMDQLLRNIFKGICSGDDYTGNRALSLARVKLVLHGFEEELKTRILKVNDRMLYAAKYLFYADMVAHRELGISMTGATYAVLPQGPQLNNYKELVEEIRKADEREAEPLSEEEKRIIHRIAKKFNKKTLAYHSSHRETVCKIAPIGSIIPYSISKDLIEI